MPIGLRFDPDERTEILYRLSRIETQLVTLMEQRSPESLWIDSTDFCKLVGIERKQLTYYMSQGVPSGKAVKNIGTNARPRYRFHRVAAVDQFLNRVKVN